MPDEPSGSHEVDQFRVMLDRHVLHCQACFVDAGEQMDGSWSPSFRYCKAGSALMDAFDTFKWTMDGAIHDFMRTRYGAPGPTKVAP